MPAPMRKSLGSLPGVTLSGGSPGPGGGLPAELMNDEGRVDLQGEDGQRSCTKTARVGLTTGVCVLGVGGVSKIRSEI